MKYFNYWTLTILTFIVLGVGSAPAQQNLAQQARAISNSTAKAATAKTAPSPKSS